MADTKLIDLSADATPDLPDLVYGIKDPGGTPLDRKLTWQTVKGLVNVAADYADSPMVVTGGLLSRGTTGTFTVAALTCLLRSTNSVTGVLEYLTLAEQANQSITAADTVYYVSLNYNDGVTPTITLSETYPYTADKRNIPIGKLLKDSSDVVHYSSGGFIFQDGVRKLHERAFALRGHELSSGSVIAYSGTNNFTMTEGTLYCGICLFTLAVYNSASTTFTPLYDDGSHTDWTEGAASNVIDFAHYDDGDGTLGEIGIAKFGCFWVYQHIGDGEVFVLYGTDSYALADAETATEPAKPDHLTDFGILIGKIVAPQAGGSFTTVQMVSDTFFSGTAVSDHNQLGNLNVGDYQHLTAAQLASLEEGVGLSPVFYKHNLVVINNTTNPNYQVDINADDLVVSTVAGGVYSAAAVNVTVDITASEVNGLDTGSEAVSTLYYMWIIYNGSTVAGLLSLSASSPTMPSGYTYKRLVGEIYNDGSGHLVKTRRVNNEVAFEDPAAIFTTHTLTTSFVQHSLPSQVPSGCTRLSFEASTALYNWQAAQVLSPDSTPRFEVTCSKYQVSLNFNAGPTGGHNSTHLEMTHLGAVTVYVKANFNASYDNQHLYVWGYKKEV